MGAIDLASLFQLQRRSMVGLARLLTGSFEIAEEVVQEAFIRLQLATTDLRTPELYLRTIVTNLCRDHLRRIRLERGSPTESRIMVSTPEIDETWEVLCQLPFRQRAVVALRYYEDLTESEIAKILNCRVGTVKSSHHRALIALRRKLS